jgi:hypothetical protein
VAPNWKLGATQRGACRRLDPHPGGRGNNMKAECLATVACEKCDLTYQVVARTSQSANLCSRQHDARRRQLALPNCSFFGKPCPIRLVDGAFFDLPIRFGNCSTDPHASVKERLHPGVNLAVVELLQAAL